ncbi:hypothetical protein AAEX28_06805 [Lentisphaerota bacterium WC36G]|nr:hypothetical protein LJT99_09670 [Lentisphaerae bacterium WC36]UDQ98818.1 hypothetical protein LJT99_04595 [Lentisphaerae bacterium WC36]
MKKFKNFLILIFILPVSLRANITKNEYIKIFKESNNIKIESLKIKNLEIEENDDLKTCIKKLIQFKSLWYGNKSADIDVINNYKMNVMKAFNKYPDCLYIKLELIRHSYGGRLHKAIADFAVLIQEDKSLPIVSYNIYLSVHMYNDCLKNYKKFKDNDCFTGILKELKIALGNNDLKNYERNITLLEDYWYSKIDVEFLKKINYSVDEEKYQNAVKMMSDSKNRNKAIWLWSMVVKNVMTYDSEKNKNEAHTEVKCSAHKKVEKESTTDKK